MLKLNMEELVPLITEVTDSGAAFRLHPHGKSMLPTIREGIDSVELIKPCGLKEYDIVLYRRDNGQYVLHRIVKVHDGMFDMCGDSQYVIEKNIPESFIIAKVSGIYKGDVYISVDDEEYINKVKKLYRKKPLQRFVGRIKTFLYPAYKLIFKK